VEVSGHPTNRSTKPPQSVRIIHGTADEIGMVTDSKNN
jgi:hypothetical protein